MAQCTGPSAVAGHAAPTATAVDPAWLAAALALPAALIAAVTTRPFVGGFSPVIKARLEVEYAGSAGDHPRALFMKLVPSDAELAALAQQIGDAVVAMVRQAHRVEAGLYALAMRSEVLRGVVPRAYHANGDQAILLADAGHEYTPLSPWSVELTEGPDIARDPLLAIVRALAVLHTTQDGIPSGTLLTWDALVASRNDRVMMPVKGSADALGELLLGFCTHYCPDAPATLPQLCTTAARVGCARIMRGIAGASRGVLHGDPNPGNVLYNTLHQHALLVDFQDTTAEAPGVMDLARVLLSAMHPASRAVLEAELVHAYCAALRIDDTEQFRRDLHLALLADAMLIMATVAFTLKLGDKAPALFTALGERSIMCLRDHCDAMLALLREL